MSDDAIVDIVARILGGINIRFTPVHWRCVGVIEDTVGNLAKKGSFDVCKTYTC